MARFSYFIDGESNPAGTITITPSRTYIYREARKRFAKFSGSIANGEVCSICGDDDGIEIHHIVPVWYSVIEFTCTNEYESIQEFHKAERNKKTVSSFCFNVNHPSNLTPLCFICHSDVQRKTDKQYKRQASKQWRIVFGKRDILKRKKYSGWKWG